MSTLSLPMRVRAARGAVNMSLDDFAKAIEMGRSTLVRIESAERTPEPHELERISRVSGLPVAFFTVEDLDEVLDGNQNPTLRDRVAGLEAQITELRASLLALSADSLQRTRAQRAQGDTDHPEELPGGAG